ncbi:transporter substrate-binding domain-containing protein [Microbacterium enclense]|uniref:Extracellular solute-binding protein, family 3 n=1 Tax=Microbacterium enclense TaxID=993073 RepID=A0A1G6GKY3_9MICO|nr:MULTISPECIES: transporter substrate-binding domain-containing protein [Microbacterium]SDB82692.1 extracellular solute-binding protein, family 3 [Microbacterium enclense]
MARSRRAATLAAALGILVLSGCGIHIPSDPDGTLEHVEGGVLRAGVSPNDGWIELGDGEPTGTEAEALTGFAESLGADVEWTIGSEESLVRGLEDGDLDVVAGGLTDKTPWTTKAGTTRPWAETTLDDGEKVKLVMLVPLGENAFLSRLESFLTEEAQRKGIAP